jgi:hypothetical protein
MATTLSKKAKDTFAVLSLLGLLAVGAPISTVKADNLPDQSASQTAVSLSEHGVLAKRFEDSAKEMQAKADEQKTLLEQYEQTQMYGRQSRNLKSNASALIRKYEQAADGVTRLDRGGNLYQIER